MNKSMTEISEGVRAARQGTLSHKAIGSLYGVTRTEEGDVDVFYRGSRVAHFHNDEVTLRTFGWETATTRKVMNAAVWQYGLAIFQKKYEWFITTRDPGKPPIKWEEGITLKLDPVRNDL